MSKQLSLFIMALFSVVLFPGMVLASEGGKHIDLTGHWVGYACLGIFLFAYLFVMAEEFTHLRKSKPVILASGIIWGLIAVTYGSQGMAHEVEVAIEHNLLEYAELLLFLLVAMTYINALQERLVFESLRAWLVRKGFGFRKLFWITGTLAFFISPVADNLTTALLMCAVVMAVGADHHKFVGLACINIVVAANAGGAFSPFGDITTLMVWQKGLVDFWTFLLLFVPSVVSYLIPAGIMHFGIPDEMPEGSNETVIMKRGAKTIMFFFICTIATAISFHQFFHLPPVVGMMTGLSYLQIFGFYLKKTHGKTVEEMVSSQTARRAEDMAVVTGDESLAGPTPFNVFDRVSRAEWDTLLFFYGVVLCVGGLGLIGYLSLLSEVMYVKMGPTIANTMVGLLSAIFDNIPVMFAVLTMNPDMSLGQWLLVTLTAGIGGSILSIGSAAGVALMGTSNGRYTFFGHLKWSPAILAGYLIAIQVHLWINSSSFTVPPAIPGGTG